MILAERQGRGELPKFFSNRENSFKEGFYVKKDVLFRVGSPAHPSGLYGIQSGMAVREVVSPDGKLHVAEVFHPGDFFGEEDWNDGRHSSRVSMAVSGAIVTVRISPDDTQSRQEVLAHTARRANALMEANEVLNHGKTEEKVSFALLDFSNPTGKGEVREVSVTQEFIANRIGLTRQQVNPEMRELRKMQAISYVGDSPITIFNAAVLRSRTGL
jgi:CRP-like cAMP-binding protein